MSFQRQVSLDMLTVEESYSFIATELLAVGSPIHQKMQEGEEKGTQHSPTSKILLRFQKCLSIFVSLKTKVI